METYIPISWLNDFIFCPYSIYLHNVYNYLDENVYHTTSQSKGKHAHSSIDNNNYSTHKDDIVGIYVYSNQLEVCGKIDIYHQKSHLLVERKRQIKTIYDGYIFQLFAQYFCLEEMGYKVEGLALHSLIDNKRYPVELPHGYFLDKFRQTLDKVKNFDPNLYEIKPNIQKCRACIYRDLCDKTMYKEGDQLC